MKELFIGLALIFLDVKVGIGQFTVDILPDFVGYYLMLSGLEAMGRQSDRFTKAKPLAVAMIAVSAILFVMEATAVTIHSQFLNFCLGSLALVADLLIGHRIVSGIREVELRRNRDLEGEKLQNFWLYMAVIQGITYACGWIPLVGTMGSIAAMVMNVCFLAAFYRTMDLYEGK